MIHTIILTNDQGEERRITASNGAVHLVQPGEEVVLLDENGQPSKVQLQQDGDDLIIIYENGERVTLEDFYAASGEGEQEEIALSADGEMSATDVSDSMGNLPDANSFSLMRFSTTAYTNFDDGLHTLESQLNLRAMGGAPGFTPSGGDNTAAPAAEVEEEEEAPAPTPDEPEVDPGDTRPTVRASIGGELDPDTGRRPVHPGTRNNQIHVLSLDTGDEGTGGERVDSSRGTLVFFGEGNFVYYYNPGAAAGQDIFIVKYPVADPNNPGRTIMISEPLIFIHAGSGEPEWVPPTYCPGGEEEFFDDPDNPRPDPAGIPSIVIASVDNAGEAGSTGGVGDPVYGDNGILIFNQDGSWDYVMDISKPLPANETETFTVTYTDVNGKVSVETLVIVGQGGGTVTHKPPFSGEIGHPGDPEPSDREIDDSATRAVIKVTSVDTGDTGTGGELVDGSRGNLVFNEDGTFDYNPSPTATPGIDTYIVEYPIEDPDHPGETILVHETLIFRHDGTGIITWEKPAVTGDLDLPLESPDIDRDAAITVTSLETSDAGIPGDLVVGDDSSIVFSVDGTFNVLIHEDSDAAAGDTETFRVTYFDNGAQTVTQDIVVRYDGDGGLHVLPFGRDHENTATEGQTGATGDLVGYDVDGGDVVFSTGSVGTYGTLSIDAATGVYNYALDNASNLVQQLAAGETVTDTFTYTVTDDEGDTVTHSVEITVVGVDDNVVGEDDAFTLSQNGTSTSASGTTRAGTGAGLMANDSDVDATDTHRITAITVGGTTAAIASGGSASVALGSGLLTVHSDGSYTFDTNHGYDGLIAGESTAETFTYTIADSQGSTSTATVTFTINGADDAPVAVDDADTTPEGTPIILDVLANDEDVDASDPLTIVEINGSSVSPGQTVILSSGATVTLNVDGTISYDPNTIELSEGETQDDSFTYTLEDNAGLTSTATATVTVTGTNDGVIANANTMSVSESGTVSAAGTTVVGTGAGLMANDSDADPNDTHRVSQITIGGVTTAVPDGGQVTVALGNGQLTIHSDGAYSFDTNGGYEGLRAGQSSVEQFTYTLTDNHGSTADATASITVTGTNDGPIAVNDSATTAEGTPVTISVRANDTDADSGDTMTITHIDGVAVSSGQTVSLASGAEVTLNPDGTVSYHPDTIELSQGETLNDSFTYTIQDAAGATSSATATASVTVTGTNDGVVANANTMSVSESGTVSAGGTSVVGTGAGLMANDSDADPNDTHRVSQVTIGGVTTAVPDGGQVTVALGNGQLTIHSDGAYSFNTNGGYEHLRASQTATEQFTYTLTDNHGSTADATATITVNGANDAPVAVNDSASTLEESPVTIAVRANDLDADSGDTMTITHINGVAVTSGQTVSLASGADVTLNPDGTVSYNPDTIELSQGQAFGDSFTYTIRDAAGSTSTATANVTVTGINDAPVANADYALGNTPGREVIINVIANDTDADGTIVPGSVDLDPLTNGIQTELVVAGQGVWRTDGNGNISFTPDEALQGQPTGITYAITDNDGATATSTASLEVTFANFDVWFGNDLSGSVDATEFNQSRVLISGMADLLPFSAANGAQAALFSWADAANQVFNVPLTSNSQQFVTDVSNYTRPFNGGTDVGAALQYGVNAILNPANGARSYADQLLIILTDATPSQINSQVSAINAAADMARANGITVVFIAIQEAATPGASLEVLRNAASLDLAGNPLLLTAGNYGDVNQAVMINMIAGIAPGHAANILNQPLLVIDDQAAVAEDGTVTLSPLDNDNHVSNDNLTITHIDGMAVSVGVPVTLASGAQVTLNMDGSVTYNPNGQFGSLNTGEADLDQFEYTVEDQSGNSVDGLVSVTVNGVSGVGPVVVDMDGDGAEFSGREDGILYDFNGDGQAEQSAWAGNDDAVLIYDQNGDGQINSDAEFAFTQYLEGAQTDLEGLRHFDTNGDGLLSVQDEEFGKFKLWQDANGDGHVNDGEMRTLAEMGIESIGLYSDGQAYSAANGHVQVHGTTQVNYTDGRTGTAADATFTHIAMALSGENGATPDITPQEPATPETPDLGQLVGEDDPGIVVDADNGETYEMGSPEAAAPAEAPAEEENVVPFSGPNPEDQAAAAAAAA